MGQEKTYADIFREIEDHSQYVFNYDQEVAENFYATDPQFSEYTQKSIASFLDSSPFTFIMEETTIIIVPPERTNYKLCGKVISADDWSPLIASTIYIEQEEIGTITGIDGTFEFEAELYKNAKCQISYVGYQTKEINCETLKKCPEITMELHPDFIKDPIVIKAYIKRGIEDGRSFNSHRFTKKNRATVLQNQEQDVMRAIQYVPGITSIDDGALNLNIRGSNSDQNLITWEDVALYDQGHFFGMVSAINPYNVEKIDIYKSNHGAEKDNRVGGIIDITLEDPITEKINGSVGTNTTEMHLNLTLPIVKNKFGIHLSGRRSIFDIWEYSPTFDGYAEKVFQNNAVFEDREEDEDDESELDEEASIINYHDYNLKSTWNITKDIKFSSSYLRSKNLNKGFQSINSLNIFGNDELETETNAWSNTLNYQINTSNKIEAFWRESDYNQSINTVINNGIDSSRLLSSFKVNLIDDEQFGLKYSNKWKNLTSTIGYTNDTKSIEITEEVEEVFLDSIVSSDEGNETFHHVYFEQAYQTDNNNIQYGLRTTYYPTMDRVFLSPSFSLRSRIRNGLFYKLSGGHYQQFINQRYETVDSELNIENRIWIINDDPNNPVLQSTKLASGFVFRKSNWLFDIEAYWHKTTGITAENPNVRNSFSSESENTTSSVGVDFLVSHRWKNYDFALYYSIANNTVNIPEFFDDDALSFPSNTDQPHIFKWTNTYSIGNLKIGANLLYKSGLPFSDTDEIIQDDEDEDFYELVFESINNERLPDYLRMDINALYSRKYLGINYEIGATLLNITNNENIGNRKILIVNSEDTDLPELQNLNKVLLPRTFLAHLRIFF